MRKVHHPKIVQRSDRRWIVVCQDCERDRESATPLGINTPVESREKAELMWENHCERRPTTDAPRSLNFLPVPILVVLRL